MLKLSAVSLFICSLCLLKIFQESQGGGWEVPQRALMVMIKSHQLSIVFFIMAMAVFFIYINVFMKEGLLDKILFFSWCALIIFAFLIIIRKGSPVDAFRLSESLRYNAFRIFYRIGFGLNLALLIKLVWTL